MEKTAKTKKAVSTKEAASAEGLPRVTNRWRPTKPTGWTEETDKLVGLMLDCGLTEEKKWGKPCFTFGGKNVAVVIPLKESCALMFFKGALLGDPKGLLTRIGEHTQAGRWIKFGSVKEIAKAQTTVKEYLYEAIEVERAGLRVPMKKTSDFKLPEELQKKFKEMPELKKAFYALTPGRQRNYIYHFSGAKQAATREARIEKYVQQILDGRGLTD
jgi:uncharacterized protein YdeI (YjbR/CyaY-like superfamily)